MSIKRSVRKADHRADRATAFATACKSVRTAVRTLWALGRALDIADLVQTTGQSRVEKIGTFNENVTKQLEVVRRQIAILQDVSENTALFDGAGPRLFVKHLIGDLFRAIGNVHELSPAAVLRVTDAPDDKGRRSAMRKWRHGLTCGAADFNQALSQLEEGRFALLKPDVHPWFAEFVLEYEVRMPGYRRSSSLEVNRA